MPTWRWFMVLYLTAAGGYGGWCGPDLWLEGGIWAFLLPPAAWALLTLVTRRGMPLAVRLALPGAAAVVIGAGAVLFAWLMAAFTAPWSEPAIRAVVGAALGLAGCGLTEIYCRSRPNHKVE
jgi:hypothetical protein